jgi:hypothetical protein
MSGSTRLMHESVHLILIDHKLHSTLIDHTPHIVHLDLTLQVESSLQRFKVSSSVSCGPIGSVSSFKKLFESNQTLLTKQILFSMTYSTNVQIYKNYGGQQVFVSRVQTELYNLARGLQFSSSFF